MVNVIISVLIGARIYGEAKMKIKSYVKSVHFKEYEKYYSGLWSMHIELKNGKSIDYKTNGKMTLKEIIDVIVERLNK